MPELEMSVDQALLESRRGQYTRFGFSRRAHNADKFGTHSGSWKGEILFSSDAPDIDEIEAARNFESLVIAGELPLHGSFWRLAYINFTFSPSAAEKETYGATVSCMVRVGYTSDVKRLNEPEIIERLGIMGINPERKV